MIVTLKKKMKESVLLVEKKLNLKVFSKAVIIDFVVLNVQQTIKKSERSTRKLI